MLDIGWSREASKLYLKESQKNIITSPAARTNCKLGSVCFGLEGWTGDHGQLQKHLAVEIHPTGFLFRQDEQRNFECFVGDLGTPVTVQELVEAVHCTMTSHLEGKEGYYGPAKLRWNENVLYVTIYN